MQRPVGTGIEYNVACKRPITAYRSIHHSNKGNWPIVFNRNDGYSDIKLKLPCGQCIGCRIEITQMWATRCVHESQMHTENSYITLTYNEESLPLNGSLYKPHFQKFMKRLRKEYGHQIRYYHCGEYGDELSRPHYHALLFGHSFQDKTFFKNENGNNHYISQELTKIWGKGHATIGDVTYQSSRYVAGYIQKKLTGQKSNGHYKGHQIEYATGSRNPGIGQPFYEKYKDDMFNIGRVILMDNRQVKIPRYYEELLKKEDPKRYRRYKALQKPGLPGTDIYNPEKTEERLRKRELYQTLTYKQKNTRSLENGKNIFS